MKALHKAQDAILVDRVAAGDARAFEILFKRYAPKLYRFIFFRIRDEALIDDFINDIFFQVWQRIQDGKKIDSFQAYLYTMARNTIIDHYRTRKQDFDLSHATSLEDDTDLESHVVLKNDIESILRLVDQLSENYKEILILRYVEDLTITEIAELIGKTTGAVKVQIHRAVKQLKVLQKKK